MIEFEFHVSHAEVDLKCEIVRMLWKCWCSWMLEDGVGGYDSGENIKKSKKNTKTQNQRKSTKHKN